MRSKKTRLKIKAVKLATAKKLKKEKYCKFCSKLANTCHHFVHQSRSNYLRCDERNLIPICTRCHMRLHSGYEPLMALELVRILGDKWRDGLIQDSNKRIRDTIGYWEKLLESLD